MTSKEDNKGYDSNELLKRAQRCKGEDFEELLKEIQAAIKESRGNDEKLLRAKKAVTARIAARGK